MDKKGKEVHLNKAFEEVKGEKIKELFGEKQMTGYKKIVLRDMIEQLGEDKVKDILSNFSCPQNPDVENFIRHKAIEFSKQNIATTHLIFTSVKNEIRLIGYFTLTIKNFYIAKG